MARIMTFGYDAAYTRDVISGRIRDFAKQLLKALRFERGEVDYSTEYSRRPGADVYSVRTDPYSSLVIV